MHNSKDDITKMQDKAFESIYIGYDLSSESHKILNIATGKIILTVNVKIEDKINNKKIKLDKKIVTDVREEILPQDDYQESKEKIATDVRERNRNREEYYLKTKHYLHQILL